MPPGALKTLLALFVHTAFAPVILQVGAGLNVTVFMQVDVHPFALVITTVRVKLPVAPAVIVTF